MRFSVPLLSIFALSALFAPALPMFGVSPELNERLTQTELPTLAQTSNTSARQAEADRLYQQGVQQYNVSQYQAAFESWQAALAIYREIDSPIGEGQTLNVLGLLFRIAGQYQIAIDYHQQALEIARRIGDRTGEVYALGNLGVAYRNLGQYERAIDLYEQHLAIVREIGDRSGEGSTLGNLGVVYASLGQYERAIDLYEQRLALAREISDRAGEGRTLANLGNAYNRLGQYERAIDLYEQSLVIARELGDRAGEGRSIGLLGTVYFRLSQYNRAIDLYEQSLVIARELGDRALESGALGNLGSAYISLNQYYRAIDFLEQSWAIVREIGDRAGEGLALGNLGAAYISLGQYNRAIDFLEQRLAIAREIEDRVGESAALVNLGNAYFRLSQYKLAIDLYEQSLTISRAIQDRAGEGNLLVNLGSTYDILGQYERSIDFYEQSLAIARAIDDRDGEARALSNLGIAHNNLRQYETAIAFFHQALTIIREIEDSAGEALALDNQAVALLGIGQVSEAELLLNQSIDIYESLRTDLIDSQRISLTDTQTSAYTNLERALITQDKTAEALAISERGRARAFVLQLANRASSDETFLGQIPTVAEIQQIARDTNTTLVTYSLIFDQALYIWVVQSTGEINFRSVEFDGADRPIINPIASLDSPVYRSAPDSELTALVNDSRAIGVVAANPEDNPQSLQSLHAILIDPIADLLPSDPNQQVAFIPQGNLFLVPFAALQDSDGTYLIEKHTILTAPSIQVFGLAHDDAVGANGHSPLQTGNALIVGNPTMPTVFIPNSDGEFTQTPLAPLIGAQREAEAIGNLFQIPVLIGDQASEARIKQLLPDASLIHLATHGLLEYGNPQTSGVLDVPGAVALAPGNGEDGLLTSAEILAMDLQAELAILSACDTGRGRITGDGVVGLSRALITAGVPSVMVSLWAVNDDSTSLLMQRFYQLLASGELTKAQALRQAQLSLLYDEDSETRLASFRAGARPQALNGNTLEGYQQPYHWAPFVLMGDGS